MGLGNIEVFRNDPQVEVQGELVEPLAIEGLADDPVGVLPFNLVRELAGTGVEGLLDITGPAPVEADPHISHRLEVGAVVHLPAPGALGRYLPLDRRGHGLEAAGGNGFPRVAVTEVVPQPVPQGVEND